MKKEIWLLVLIIAVGVAIRLAVAAVFSSLYPPVDIYVVDQQAARLILNLQNPYTFTYMVHHYTLAHFAYLPMVPIYYAPFSLLGDIRIGNIFADVLIILAAYWIAKSLNCRTAVYAPLVFAVMPLSIWLTSVTSTNFMVGTAFLMLSFAFLFKKNFAVAAVLLGLAIGTNQLMILMLPLFGVYYWNEHKFSRFFLSLAVSAAIILPFFLYSPTKFFYDVVEYQFVRPLQPDGPFSLYSILSTTFRVQLNTWIRVLIFSIPFFILSFWHTRRPEFTFSSACIIMFLAALVLPVNGLWNYFLPSIAIACALIPMLGDEIEKRTQDIKWLPHPFQPD
jgi:hypothetical protein